VSDVSPAYVLALSVMVSGHANGTQLSERRWQRVPRRRGPRLVRLRWRRAEAAPSHPTTLHTPDTSATAKDHDL